VRFLWRRGTCVWVSVWYYIGPQTLPAEADESRHRVLVAGVGSRREKYPLTPAVQLYR
jgi:hypothetical protein